jgi:hypothetical protein
MMNGDRRPGPGIMARTPAGTGLETAVGRPLHSLS